MDWQATLSQTNVAEPLRTGQSIYLSKSKHWFGQKHNWQIIRSDFMRWFGIGLALVGVAGALVGWFSFENVPVTIGGAVCLVVGLIVFIYGTRTLPK